MGTSYSQYSLFLTSLPILFYSSNLPTLVRADWVDGDGQADGGFSVLIPLDF
jgi:hypothetical protein